MNLHSIGKNCPYEIAKLYILEAFVGWMRPSDAIKKKYARAVLEVGHMLQLVSSFN